MQSLTMHNLHDDPNYHYSGRITQEDDLSLDETDDVFDFKTLLATDKKSYMVDYLCFAAADIWNIIQAESARAMEMLSVDASTASLLLRHAGWNREQLIDKYVENPAQVLQAAGIRIQVPQDSNTSTSSHIQSALASCSCQSTIVIRHTARHANPIDSGAVLPPVGCLVCCDDQPISMLALVCNHNYCSDCWAEYLRGKISGEGECNIRCMAEDCTALVPDSFVQETCDADVRERFDELVLRDYVGHAKVLKYCPAPDCQYAVSCMDAPLSSLSTVVPTVTCRKNHSFCFGCPIEGDHRPLICAVAKLWLEKCREDSETATWMKSNTQECPECHAAIEKNGGCNHMTCRKCKHEYCWVCIGPWSEHDRAWYNCTRFNEKSSTDARIAQATSRAPLDRYLHCFNRWAQHEGFAKLSGELYARTEKKMQEMQKMSQLSWIEVQFARRAVDEIVLCRTTLKWTYAMAYYLEEGNAKALFEGNQHDLEKAVEDLYELLEAPIEAEQVATLRQKMLDKTAYLQKRNEIILEDTANGYLEGRWAWNHQFEGIEV
ncbi:hypothetical protein BKA62DRAFT_65974 [Auriculariales sp. MPI-PUGE-AT-0066]|nr:hypothetical protein BKA62DRAFT_65974 [Auriculariales sp. MPI-PUGE-AT-0066]